MGENGEIINLPEARLKRLARCGKTGTTGKR
jgi:hypothetical protein